jgi:hypothetical protein
MNASTWPRRHLLRRSIGLGVPGAPAELRARPSARLKLLLERLETRVNPGFLTPLTFGVGSQPDSVALGDFNGDGRPDLAVANSGSNTVSVLLGNGDGTFQAARNFGVGNTPDSVAVGDFNRDGRPDLAVANFYGNDVSVLLGNGDGTFQAASNFSVGGLPASVAVGDFNGDGRPDLAAAIAYQNTTTNGDSVDVLLGNGDGTFQAPRAFTVGVAPTSVAVGDFNGDGRPDLVTANSGGDGVSVLLGNGDGTFQAPRNSVATGQPFAVAVGDFNRDGRPDVAVADGYFGGASALLGNGDGTFQAPYSVPVSDNGIGSAALGDLNGDGRSDLVTTGGSVFVLLGNPDVTLEGPLRFSAGTGDPSSVAVGDVNGDGRPDVVATLQGSNQVSVLRNDGNWRVFTVVSTQAGRADVVVRFNRPVDVASAHLYGPASLGPADLTLVGPAGAVAGSLVFNAAHDTATFVPTGGLLPAGSYTLTLFSGPQGLHDTLGNALDGNADGTPGDSFTTTFSLAASPVVTVGVPDFARGPGQPVNVPAGGNGLPLSLSDGAGVTRAQVTVVYDPALLTITGVVRGPDAPPGASVTVDTTTIPGNANVTYNGPALPAGRPAAFASLLATVPATAPYLAKEEITAFPYLNSGTIAATGDPAVHVVGYLGDVSGDGFVNAFDNSLIQRVILGLDTGFAAYKDADPRVVADINGDGFINAFDNALVQRFILGQNPPQIPPIPNGVTLTQGADPLVSIPKGLTVAPGGSVSVPVNFLQTAGAPIGLGSFDLVIAYDPAEFTAAGVRAGSLTAGFTVAWSTGLAPGLLYVSMSRLAGPVRLAPGTSGTLAVLDLVARSGARPGSQPLNLLSGVYAGGEPRATELNDRGLTLAPAPTNAADDPIDGSVVITAVPTPSRGRAAAVATPGAVAAALKSVWGGPAEAPFIPAAAAVVAPDPAMKARPGWVIPAGAAPPRPGGHRAPPGRAAVVFDKVRHGPG